MPIKVCNIDEMREEISAPEPIIVEPQFVGEIPELPVENLLPVSNVPAPVEEKGEFLEIQNLVMEHFIQGYLWFSRGASRKLNIGFGCKDVLVFEPRSFWGYYHDSPLIVIYYVESQWINLMGRKIPTMSRLKAFQTRKAFRMFLRANEIVLGDRFELAKLVK